MGHDRYQSKGLACLPLPIKNDHRPGWKVLLSFRRGRLCMFNAGLGHNCDFKDAMGKPKREFLDINFSKDSSLLLHDIHSLSTGGFLKKPHSTLVLKLHTKKSAKQENAGLFVNSIL